MNVKEELIKAAKEERGVDIEILKFAVGDVKPHNPSWCELSLEQAAIKLDEAHVLEREDLWVYATDGVSVFRLARKIFEHDTVKILS